ncbi:MAG: NIL domain-containing protein [Candidatus Omnitrophota bacterium]|nr:NIL domain-containing protein [Candidatus Omnitrophota bacterium]
MKTKIELTFPVELKNEPIIYYLGNKFNIIPNIIEASFSTDVGWAVLILEGKESEINKALAYLKSRKISINIREK